MQQRLETYRLLTAGPQYYTYPPLVGFHPLSMSGGTMFEQHHAPLPMHSSQEMMADWSATPSMNGMRRDKEMIAPSPTYSHASQVESVASPYSHPQTLMMPGYAPGGYVASTPVVQSSHYPTSQATSYYTAPVEYDIYQTPASARSTARGKLGRTPSAYGDQQAFTPTPVGTHSGYDVGVPLVAASSSLTRTYDSTITQYYPYTSDRSSWGSAPDKDVGQKRKRAVKEALQPLMTNKPAVTSSAKSLRTPKRSKHDGDKWSQPEMNSQASHLPTPPATGNEASTTAASRQKKSDTKRSVTPADSVSSGASSEKRRVGIKTSAEEGRVLVVGAAAAAESADGEDVQDASATETKAERKLAMPALSTDESGLAILSTDMVLESELDWLQNGGRASPPSSPDQAVLQTPVLGPRLLDAEVTDTPMTKASKVTRRLERFAQEPVTKADEPMICTKINMFGRVAVRKDMAIKFLGLDGGAGLVEQIKHEDEDDWSERLTAASSSQSAAAASSSTAAVKPSWPDELAPWSLAGGSRKEKIRKEESEKADMLKRYLEGASDESSDDEDEFVPTYGAMGKGKGKSVSRLVSGPIAAAGHGSHRDPRRPAYRASYYNPSADAKAALLTVLRHRALPVIAPGVVACLCGAQTANGMGSMIACHSCKTWHHLVCNNLADGDQLTPRWWCPSCEQSMRNATPIRTPVGAYIQAVERSSAFKGDMVDVALAPSPLFPTNGFSRVTHPLQTPLLPARAPGSPGRPPQRQRVLSFANDLWTYPEDGAAAPSSAAPSTPAPASRRDEFSTPKPDDLPFDVHSTPSRHLDSIFGGSSLFPMTPAHGRARVPSSGMMNETPMTLSSRLSGHGSLASRHDYLRDLGNGEQATPTPAMGGLLPPPSPQTSKWPHALMGAQNLSPSPFGHRRSMSGSNKLSSMRSSSRSSVMGLGLPLDKDDE